jgi:hypothetical protein
MAVMKTSRRVGTIATIVLLIAGSAQAADRAALIAAINAACSGDKDRLCADVPVEGTARCFREHWSEISPECKDVINQARAAIREQMARRTAI